MDRFLTLLAVAITAMSAPAQILQVTSGTNGGSFGALPD
jgi:hypothetical protein